MMMMMMIIIIIFYVQFVTVREQQILCRGWTNLGRLIVLQCCPQFAVFNNEIISRHTSGC
jgi:hypothetical protein